MIRGSTPRDERQAKRQLAEKERERWAKVLAGAKPFGYPGPKPKVKKPRAKRVARGTAAEMKKKIAEYRRRQATGLSTRASTMPLNSATAAYALLLNARKKAARRAALARRMRNPAFANRYARKVLGQRYRQGGRLLGANYKAPAYMRKPGRDGKIRTTRVQAGAGLLKYKPRPLDGFGKYSNLIGGMDASVMRMGDFASKASLMDYAKMMRDKARAAYVERKRRKGKSSAVRTPMTKEERKEARRAAAKRAYKKRKARTQAATTVAAAYRGKKARRAAALANMPLTRAPNTSSPMSGVDSLSMAKGISGMFSPGPPPSPPRRKAPLTRAAAERASAALMARAAAAARRPSRTTRSMVAPRRSARFM